MKNMCFITLAMVAMAMPSLSMAATVWTNWSAATAGAPGSAAGNLNGVTVSYMGEVDSNTVINGTSGDWSNPATSFIGGTVTTSPSAVGDIITENGSYTGVNTLTFSSPVVDPVFAVWSLGGVVPVSMTFTATPTFEAGGPDVYGGGPITVSGNTVSGKEGSGVVQFTGTFSSISWTDTPENYYGFTVGENGGSVITPEPSSIALLAAGAAGFCLLLRRRRS